MSEHILNIKDVYQQYDDHVVLNNINLSVEEGEFITVVGPTGCGKSTLLRLILGQEKPYAGLVEFDGKQITGPDRDRGVVFQKYSLFPHKKVIDNVMFGPELETFTLFEKFYNPFRYKKKMAEFREEAIDVLTRVRLEEHVDKYPHQLSGGQRQRTAIAQGMMMKPRMILMDEPFGALDHGTREEMQIFTLEQWNEHKQTVLFVTHDLEEAIFMGTRLIVVSQYYKHENDSKGAKIVKDVKIPWNHPRATDVKYTTEFTDLMQQIKYEGLDPNYLQDIGDFDLSHKDSMQKLHMMKTVPEVNEQLEQFKPK